MEKETFEYECDEYKHYTTYSDYLGNKGKYIIITLGSFYIDVEIFKLRVEAYPVGWDEIEERGERFLKGSKTLIIGKDIKESIINAFTNLEKDYPVLHLLDDENMQGRVSLLTAMVNQIKRLRKQEGDLYFELIKELIPGFLENEDYENAQLVQNELNKKKITT